MIPMSNSRLTQIQMLSIIPLLTCLAISSVKCGFQDYQHRALDWHNYFRRDLHKVEQLVMTTELNEIALKCAKHYVKLRAIDHSCPEIKSKTDLGVNQYGENIVGSAGLYSAIAHAEYGIVAFYNEIDMYDYSKNKFQDGTGHFTQLIWKDSKQFGWATWSDGVWTASVGTYDPPGNYDEEFTANVLPQTEPDIGIIKGVFCQKGVKCNNSGLPPASAPDNEHHNHNKHSGSVRYLKGCENSKLRLLGLFMMNTQMVLMALD